MTGWAQRQAEEAEDQAEADRLREEEDRRFWPSRQGQTGQIDYLARSQGWVMAQVLGEAKPFVIPADQYLALPSWAERCTCYKPSVTGIGSPCRNPACIARIVDSRG